jgi:hypothetical protein
MEQMGTESDKLETWNQGQPELYKVYATNALNFSLCLSCFDYLRPNDFHTVRCKKYGHIAGK